MTEETELSFFTTFFFSGIFENKEHAKSVRYRKTLRKSNKKKKKKGF